MSTRMHAVFFGALVALSFVSVGCKRASEAPAEKSEVVTSSPEATPVPPPNPPGVSPAEPGLATAPVDREVAVPSTAQAPAAAPATGYLPKAAAKDPAVVARPPAVGGPSDEGKLAVRGGWAPPPAKAKSAPAFAPRPMVEGAEPLGANRPSPVTPQATKPMDLAKGAQAVAPREEASVDAPQARPALDPNARYATTYRPGGAALSAFDAAVGRGDIPVEYKDLVGDFGARYASTMPAPTDVALAFRAEPERTKVAPSGGKRNFRISLRSSASETVRAPLSVHLVLDVSGSMSGNAIDNARKAAQSLVERLDAKDDFSMVTFSNSAEVLVADGPVGPRRKKILETIEQVHANGGTNISAGLDLGYAQAHDPKISPEAVKIVMFLSDGHANGGDTRPDSLAERSARAFQDGIQTSAFGLGADFDAPLMSSIADRGAGGYYFLADSSQIAGALAKEMDSRLVPAALGVEVRVRLRPDVVPLRVYGSHALEQREAAQVRAQEVAMDVNAAKKQGIARDRQEDAPGGMRFFMPAFAKDDRHAILMELQIPPGTGSRPLGSVEIKYKDRLRKKNTTDELPVTVVYASSDAESSASADASVVATVQAFLAGDSIVQAERLVDRELRLPATRLLQERAEILKRAATTLSDPRLGEDAIRLARLSRAIGGGSTPDSVKSVPLAVLLRGSAYGYLK